MAEIPQPPSDRVGVRRLPARGHYDPERIAAILDEAMLVHVGFVVDGQPYVIPTLHARVGKELFLHGSPASRMLKTLKDGVSCCVTASLIDGIVLARSAFHHSMNYRSVVVLGTAHEVTDRETKYGALAALVEKTVPGRASGCRMPNDEEMRRTTVLAMPIDEASAKIRTGPPGDEEEDYALGVWAGVVPVSTALGEPIPDPKLRDGIAMPKHVRDFVENQTHRG